jgi:hypothetical protein
MEVLSRVTRIIRVSIRAFMHNHGGRLYGTNTTGQQLWVELHFQFGLKPSVAIPNIMFQEYDAI